MSHYPGLCELFPVAGIIELRRSKGIGVTANDKLLTEYLFVMDPEEEWSQWKELGSVRLPHKRWTYPEAR